MQDPKHGFDPDSPTLAGAAEGEHHAGAAVKTPGDSSSPSSQDLATIADAGPIPGTSPAKPQSEFSGSSAIFAPGTLLGARYQILKILGQGGMGAVYQARDQELDRTIALKVIRPDLASNAGILQRFKQELILSRNVTHKNVVRIFDLGEAEGTKFITMEFIEGEDLRGVLRHHGKFRHEKRLRSFSKSVARSKPRTVKALSIAI